MWGIGACRISTIAIATCDRAADRGPDGGACNSCIRAGRDCNLAPGFNADDGCSGHVPSC